MTVDSSIVSGNSALGTGTDPEAYGAGVYIGSGTAQFTHVTAARNVQQGLWVGGGTVSVLNSIFYFNNKDLEQIHGSATVTYSDVENNPFDPADGNIDRNPAFAGTGSGCNDLVILSGSPCEDAGDPLGPPDSCSPPSLGSPSADMGAHGGPRSCFWELPFEHLFLDIHPAVASAGETLKFHTAGGIPREPVLMAVTRVNGAPMLILVPYFASLCPAGMWEVSFPYEGSLAGLEVCLMSISLGPDEKGTLSNEECVTFH
jgi:hypothetical protein